MKNWRILAITIVTLLCSVYNYKEMRYYTKGYKEKLSKKVKFPCLVLVTNSWNDYGYVTTFKLFYYVSEETRNEIGDIKILDKNSKTTLIKESFTKLSPDFGSLGQSLDYYTNLKKYLPGQYQEIINELNDLAINQGLRDEFEKLEGFKVSLLRFSEAEKVLSEASRILLDDENSINNTFSFTYSVKLENADNEHIVSFYFDNGIDDSFRSFVLIGKNGTGKTQYLSNLASSLCDINSTGEFSPSRPLFSRIIAISFSLFDKFKIPKSSKHFSYKYIGYRYGEEILNDEALSNRLKSSFNQIKKENREYDWFNFIKEIVELEYFGIDLNTDFPSDYEFEKIINKRTDFLSSGQNILMFIITELIANLRRNSIVLFDEPETHLHPNSIAKLVKIINSILMHYNSYAIIATHSPIVIQETPSFNVRVFDRIGNTSIISPLAEESFGENIAKITDIIFYRNQVKEAYKEFFDSKIEKLTLNEINERFGNKLSLSALIYLNAIEKKKNR